MLVIDGDSFAHRSYHALPKTIRRSDSKAAGAILGFANFVLRLYPPTRELTSHQSLARSFPSAPA
jgi:DNA polymerase I